MAIATFDTLKFANTPKSFRSRRSAALPRAENPIRFGVGFALGLAILGMVGRLLLR
jgi:hypothetical protein